MVKHSKRYNTAIADIEEDKSYSLEDAIDMVKSRATAKFDETVELHLRTGADPRHAEQMIRGVVILPNGIGKTISSLVFCQGDAAQAARDAGADHVGDDDLIEKIESGWTDFDVAIATPDMMGKIGKLGPILGRKGLMPNPRTGTVVPGEDVAKAVEESKKGRLEFKIDKSSIIHTLIGKASFEKDQLTENMAVLMESIVSQRPSGLKGEFIKSAYITTTMGPSVSIEVASIMSLTVK
ncbi:MAG: 50S ribosomal protein L1 [SAR202 cluster bacterium]|nr:50S ribosomal protein L1 [Chloroflexota bacterium]MQG22108.1 50S ribosomal protein L1 [SAR202 cluster bacterium]|tara:strand:+ start:1071 stop:1784 length:714 start_codon:yes stop_codon:yes gene_type:complete